MDESVRLWDLAAGKEVGRLEGHRSWVQTVAFSPDGTKLVSGGIDTAALIWDVSRFTKRGPSVELTAKDLESCWEDLGRDAAIAYRSIGRLSAGPERAVAFLQEKLKPAPGADVEHIKQLIADLDSKQFKTRDLATRELEKLGGVAAPAVQKAIAGKLTLEMQRRLEQLLEKLEDASLPPAMLRQIRAVEFLEGAGTPQARKLLERLATGAPEGRLTVEAEASLQRMKGP
jgi:hypothetical protein